MSGDRRVTRRSNSLSLVEKQQKTEFKVSSEIRQKLKKAITSKKFQQALLIINSVLFPDHWISCREAYVLFQLGQIQNSLNCLKNLLRIEPEECFSCSELLLRIYKKSSSKNLKRIQKLIKETSEFRIIPQKLRRQLNKALQQINRITWEEPATSLDFIKLTDHYEKKGARFDKAEIVQVNNEYRVVVAKTPIGPNQIIISIPEEEMITLERAKYCCPELNKIHQIQSDLKSPKHCLLSMFLLIQKQRGLKSQYYKYIRCLPKKLDNFPIFYDNELYSELKNTSFLPILIKKKKQIKEDYEKMVQTFPQHFKTITERQFYWARMVTSSRIFGLSIGLDKTDALVPIADMLNHKTPKMTSWYYCDKARAFQIQNGPATIFNGQQIFDSYGAKCNSRFLLNYGFALEVNECNEVFVSLKKYSSDRYTPNLRLTIYQNTDQFKMLMNYYRSYVSYENATWEQDQEPVEEFLTKSNQLQAWCYIMETFMEKLKAYPTSIKYDEKLLKKENLSQNLRNCIIVRLGQKKILDFYIKMAKAMMGYFSKDQPIKQEYLYRDYLRSIYPPQEQILSE